MIGWTTMVEQQIFVKPKNSTPAPQHHLEHKTKERLYVPGPPAHVPRDSAWPENRRIMYDNSHQNHKMFAGPSASVC